MLKGLSQWEPVWGYDRLMPFLEPPPLSLPPTYGLKCSWIHGFVSPLWILTLWNHKPRLKTVFHKFPWSLCSNKTKQKITKTTDLVNFHVKYRNPRVSLHSCLYNLSYGWKLDWIVSVQTECKWSEKVKTLQSKQSMTALPNLLCKKRERSPNDIFSKKALMGILCNLARVSL